MLKVLYKKTWQLMHGYYSELQWNICLIQLSGFIILHFHSMGNVKSVFRLNNSRKKRLFCIGPNNMYSILSNRCQSIVYPLSRWTIWIWTNIRIYKAKKIKFNHKSIFHVVRLMAALWGAHWTENPRLAKMVLW